MLVDAALAAGLRALVDNQGLIRAPGGQIILTAAGRDSLLRAAVTNTGTVAWGDTASSAAGLRFRSTSRSSTGTPAWHRASLARMA